MAIRSFRLNDNLLKKRKKQRDQSDLLSRNALVREAISNEIERGGTAIEQIGVRIAASTDRLSREIRKASTTRTFW